MIARMALDVEDMLRAQGFPLRVAYGPEAHERQAYDNGIVIERDREGGDALRAIAGSRVNPRGMRVRDQGCVATVYAASTLPGARVQDHEHVCDAFVDALLIALEEWGAIAKAGDIPISAAGYVAARERNDVQTWPGVVYRIKFRVPRAVLKRNFAGEARPTGTIAGVTNRTDVYRAGAGDSDTPSTGCGVS